MPSAAKNKGLVNWTYGDWRRQRTLDAQIDRLIRHIEEVEKFAFESQNKGQRLTLHQNMLDRLEKNLDRLTTRQALGSSGLSGRVGKVSKFKRGGDA